MTDRVFGPPCTMGRFGYAGMSCSICDVAWSPEGQGPRCWVCGLIGQYKSVSFAGTNIAYVDEPPLAYRKKAA